MFDFKYDVIETDVLTLAERKWHSLLVCVRDRNPGNYGF